MRRLDVELFSEKEISSSIYDFEWVKQENGGSLPLSSGCDDAAIYARRVIENHLIRASF